jgi:serine/threonine protein kinase
MGDELEAGIRIGDFRIVRRLGAGGMGIVYLARQVSLDRLVALKVLGPALDARPDIARFQREARAVARLNHPGIASVYFVGQDRHVCFIAMEYIAGASLREVLKRLSMLSQPGQSTDTVLRAIPLMECDAPEVRFDQETAPLASEPEAGVQPVVPGLTTEAKKLMATPDHIRRCCEIVRDAALALAHAHERGVVHRDVKPENLLMDCQGSVHLIDFGLARFFEDITLTNTGALVGTPMYMSPEQVTGRINLDHRTDIYSLGLVLYELLTLRRPISAATREALLRKVVTKALPPVSQWNRGIPRDLEGVVHRATNKDPDERYQTSEAFAQDLQRWLDGRQTTAPPYRFRFDEREIAADRPRELLSGAIVFFLMGIVSVVLGSVSALALWLGGSSSMRVPYLTIATAFVASGVGCHIVGRGMLSGRRRILHVAVITTVILVSTLAATLSVVGGGNEQMKTSVPARILISSVVCLPMMLATVMLTRKATRKWLVLVERLRFEHERGA